MFFLARSALCIGLVAAAASTAGGSPLGAAVEGGTREAARTASQACLRSVDCLRIGAELLAPVTISQPVPQAGHRTATLTHQDVTQPSRRAATARDKSAPKG